MVFGGKAITKKEQKEEKLDSRHKMATMHTCSGLVGPKSGNIEKPLVFKGFFEGSRGPRVRQEN